MYQILNTRYTSVLTWAANFICLMWPLEASSAISVHVSHFGGGLIVSRLVQLKQNHSFLPERQLQFYIAKFLHITYLHSPERQWPHPQILQMATYHLSNDLLKKGIKRLFSKCKMKEMKCASLSHQICFNHLTGF